MLHMTAHSFVGYKSRCLLLLLATLGLATLAHASMYIPPASFIISPGNPLNMNLQSQNNSLTSGELLGTGTTTQVFNGFVKVAAGCIGNSVNPIPIGNDLQIVTQH